MTVEIISWPVSTKVWDRAGMELKTPGSADRHASVARHVTNCATRPGKSSLYYNKTINAIGLLCSNFGGRLGIKTEAYHILG